jgi:hypothetical protein
VTLEVRSSLLAVLAGKMTSSEICEQRAAEARVRAEQSVYPDEREAWLTAASEWTKIAHQPINGLMGTRTYAVRARQLP